MSALFIQSACRLPPDCVVQCVAWSPCESLLAIATRGVVAATTDGGRDTECFQVIVVNSEVRSVCKLRLIVVCLIMALK